MHHLVHHYTFGKSNMSTLILLCHCLAKCICSYIVESLYMARDLESIIYIYINCNNFEMLQCISLFLGYLNMQLVSDNDLIYLLRIHFLSSYNNIKHFRSTPYHLSTNSIVERPAQTLNQEREERRLLESMYTL